jgi:non-specific protein-tyrosine kinase
LAFGIDALDARVRSTTEVAEQLGLPLLARIPPPPKKLRKSEQLVTIAHPRGTQAEAFRVLRTNLEFSLLGADDVKSLLLTSAIEEEGKSVTAANFAVTLARSGRRVCLIDLDLRRPCIDRFFGLLHAPGITDVALGLATLDEALTTIDLATGLPRQHDGHSGRTAPLAADGDAGTLDVFVSGSVPPDPGEFVGTRRLAEILVEVEGRHDIVVIDSPPLLRVGDAMTLSSRVDAILVVTRLNVVRRPMLKELKRVLDAAPAKKLGFVATGSRNTTGYTGSYGYGDGYREAYYSRNDETSPDPAEVPRGNGRGGVSREEHAV